MNFLKLIVISLFLATASHAANAENLQFTLINSTKYVITKLQISPLSTDQWEENILGRDVLRQGEEATVTIADGLSTCKYDMLITFNDDTNIEERGYDFCDLQSYEARN